MGELDSCDDGGSEEEGKEEASEIWERGVVEGGGEGVEEWEEEEGESAGEVGDGRNDEKSAGEEDGDEDEEVEGSRRRVLARQKASRIRDMV